jgi:hypothetical protein
MNADGTVVLPMPTVVIADAGHVVRWIDVHPDYSTRTETGADPQRPEPAPPLTAPTPARLRKDGTRW